MCEDPDSYGILTSPRLSATRRRGRIGGWEPPDWCKKCATALIQCDSIIRRGTVAHRSFHGFAAMGHLPAPSACLSGQAYSLFDACQAVQEEALGPRHPNLLTSPQSTLKKPTPTKVLIRFYPTSQGKLAEADRLFVRAIEAGEKSLGPDHLKLALWLHNRAKLLLSQVRAVLHLRKCCRVYKCR